MHDRDYALVEEFSDAPIPRKGLEALQRYRAELERNDGKRPAPAKGAGSGAYKSSRSVNSNEDVDVELAGGMVIAPECTGHSLTGRCMAIESGPRQFELVDVQ